MTWTLTDVRDELLAGEDALRAADAAQVEGADTEYLTDLSVRARRHWERARVMLDDILVTHGALRRPLSPEEFAEARRAQEPEPPRPVEVVAVGGRCNGTVIRFSSLDERAWTAEIGESDVAVDRTAKDGFPNFPPAAKVKGYYEPTESGDKALWHPVSELDRDAPVC